MELLLTPVVNRLLRKFVKSSQEGNDDYGAFKASMSGGGIALHNLELDLSTILAPLEAKRAFARFLEVKIPWTALSTQPIEIVFDTVEIILSPPTDLTNTSHKDTDQLEQPQTDTETSTISSWLGTSWLSSGLRSLVMRVGLNLSFSIKNLLIKYIHNDQFVLTVALEKLSFRSDQDKEWHELVREPSAWLKKDASLKGLSITLDPVQPSSASPSVSYLPLLRLSSFRFSVLSPIFAYIEGIDLLGDVPKVSVGVELGKTSSCVNDQQLAWMKQLSDFLSILQDDGGDNIIHTTETSTITASKNIQQRNDHTNRIASRTNQLACLGPLGNIWFLVVEKAAYLEELEMKQSTTASSPPPPSSSSSISSHREDSSSQLPSPSSDYYDTMNVYMQAELSIFITSIALQLDKASTTMHSNHGDDISMSSERAVVVPYFLCEIGKTELYSSSISSDIQEIDLQIYSVSFKHRTIEYHSNTSSLLHHKDKSNNSNLYIWDEFLGIHAILPAIIDGQIEESEPCFHFLWRAQTDEQDAVCLIMAGQLWTVYNNGLIDDFNAIVPGSSNNQSDTTEDDNNNTIDRNSDEEVTQQWWWHPYINNGIDVDIGVLHCIIKSQDAPHALALISTGLQYQYSPQHDDQNIDEKERISHSPPPPVHASFTIAIIHDNWQPCSDRSHLSALPHAIDVCDTFNIAYIPSSSQLRISSIDITLQNNAIQAILSSTLGCVHDDHNLMILHSVRIFLADGIHMNMQEERNGDGRCMRVGKLHIAVSTQYSSESPVIASVLHMQNILCRFSGSLIDVGVDVSTIDVVPSRHLSPSVVLVEQQQQQSDDGDGDDSDSHVTDANTVVMAHQQPLCTITNASYSQHTSDDNNNIKVSMTSINVCADSEMYHAVGDVFASINMLSSFVSSLSQHNDNEEEALVVMNNSTVASSFALMIDMMSYTLFPGSSTEKKDDDDNSGITGFISHAQWKTRGDFDREFSMHCFDMALCKHGQSNMDDTTVLRLSNKKEHQSPALIFSISLTQQSIQPQRNFSLQLGSIEASCSPIALSTISLLQQSLIRSSPDESNTRNNIQTENATTTMMSPPLLRGTIIFDQPVSITACLDPWQPTTALQLCMQEAFILVHEESTIIEKECAASVLSTVCDGTVVDLRLDVIQCNTNSNSNSNGGGAVVLPMTCRVIMQQWKPTGRLAMALSTDEVHLKVSQSLVAVVNEISQGFNSSSNGNGDSDGGFVTVEGENTSDTTISDTTTSIAEDDTNTFECLPSFAMSFASDRCIVSMLPHSVLSAADLALLRLSATDFKCTMHKWSDDHVNADAVNVGAKVCMTYADSAGRQTMLIDHTAMRVGYTSGREGTRSVEGKSDDDNNSKQINGSTGGINEEDDVDLKMMMRQQPLPKSGVHTAVVFETPMVVHLNELALYDVQRAYTLIMTPSEVDTVPSPLHVVNSSSLDMVIGQVDTAMNSTIVSGSSLDVHWQYTQTKRLAMQLACSPPKKTEMLGVDGSLLLAWSDPIEVMATGGRMVPIKIGNDEIRMLAIEVKRDGPTWHVELHDGLQVWNHHPLSEMCLLISYNDRNPTFISIEAGKKRSLPMIPNSTTLRVLLGKAKWSQLLQVGDDSDGVQVLDVDDSFAVNASYGLDDHLDGTPMLVKLQRKSESGILQLDVWPPIVLINELPLPGIALQKTFVKDAAPMVLRPRTQTALSVGVRGGEVMRLNVGNTIESYAVRVFCPPLVSREDDEDDDFIADSRAVFVPPPGESVLIAIPEQDGSFVPCVLSTEDFSIDNGPCLHLRLQPRFMIESMLPVETKLFLQGYPNPIIIPPSSKLVLKEDIAESMNASLGVAPSLRDAMFKSGRFSLASDQNAIVRLPHEKHSHQWITIAVSIEGKSAEKLTTIKLTLAPAHYISNQTDGDIRICPNPQDSHASVMSLPVGRAVPLLAIWSNHQDTKFPSLHIAGSGESSAWSDAIYLRDQNIDSARLLITDQGSSKLLTYSILEEESKILHLVLFTDRQPPYVITNNCDRELNIELSSVDFPRSYTFAIASKSSIDFGVTPQQSEIEDAIAEHNIFPCIAIEESISLRLRSHTSQWSSPLVITEGESLLDRFTVRTAKRGRSLYITINPASSLAVVYNAIDNASLTLAAAGIQVVLWDDGRGMYDTIPAESKILSVEVRDIKWVKISSNSKDIVQSSMRLTMSGLDCTAYVPTSTNIIRFSSKSPSFALSVESASFVNGEGNWIDTANVQLPSLSIYVDDDVFKLIKHCQIVFDSLKLSDDNHANAANESSSHYREAIEQPLFIGELSISDLSALVDLHLSVANTGLPMAIDTHRSPVTISGVQSQAVFGSTNALFQSLKAHVVAEALFNAGSVVGSLQLLGNPTGLVRSIKRGVTDIIDKGIGAGSVTLVKEVSDWSVSSTVGFFNAFIGLRRKK